MLTNTQTPDGYYVGVDGRWVSGASSGSLAGETVSYTLIGREWDGMPADINDCDDPQNISIRYLSDSNLEMDWNGDIKNLKKSWGSCWHGIGETWIEFKGDKLYVTGATDHEEYIIYAESGSAASQQAAKEDKWTGEYDVKNGDNVIANNNGLQIKGYFNKRTGLNYQNIGYHEKKFTFSDNCKFGVWEDKYSAFDSKAEFLQWLNEYKGAGLILTIENDVITQAALGS